MLNFHCIFSLLVFRLQTSFWSTYFRLFKVIHCSTITSANCAFRLDPSKKWKLQVIPILSIVTWWHETLKIPLNQEYFPYYHVGQFRISLRKMFIVEHFILRFQHLLCTRQRRAPDRLYTLLAIHCHQHAKYIGCNRSIRRKLDAHQLPSRSSDSCAHRLHASIYEREDASDRRTR